LTFKNLTSIFLLILSNLVPILGALFFGWDVGLMMLAYWCETAILGFYNILKILKANDKVKSPDALLRQWGHLPQSKLGIVAFFMFHFGAFMFGHLILLSIFVLLNDPTFFTVIQNSTHSFFISLLMMFLSHGVSFKKNFIEGGEWKRVNSTTQMTRVYSRVVVMHFTIFIAAIALITFGLYGNVAAITGLALLKMAIDLHSHHRSHLSSPSNS
jgi:hypothetical protein